MSINIICSILSEVKKRNCRKWWGMVFGCGHRLNRTWLNPRGLTLLTRNLSYG